MGNFFYMGLRLRFEGFDNEINYSELFSDSTFGCIKELNAINSLKAIRTDENVAKRMNIEVKKLIKNNKVNISPLTYQ